MNRFRTPIQLLVLSLVSAANTAAWEVPGSVLRAGQRQLFIDDFVIGDIHRVRRVIHPPKKFDGNPVIRPDLPTDGPFIEMPSAPSWDELEQVWKVWYWATGDGEGTGCRIRSFQGRPDLWRNPPLDWLNDTETEVTIS